MKAKADCSDKGGIFTPLIEDPGHQPVLSKIRQNKTRTDRMFNVWTGVSRKNSTHFTDNTGLWINTEQPGYSKMHRNCVSENVCALVYALFANIRDGGTRLEWSNDIMRAGPTGLRLIPSYFLS